MSEEYKLIDSEYPSKEEALVEITETKEPIIIISNANAKNLQETIDLLNERKQQAVDKFDKEIKINQDRLNAIQPIIETAKVAKAATAPTGYTGATGDTGATGYTI